ncbi:MAG: hypothetical protein ACXWCZ_13295, partial [Flavisolibacter sp.]
MKKLILPTLFFYIICLLVLLIVNGFFIEKQSFTDILGFVLTSMVYLSFLSVIYFFTARYFTNKNLTLGFSILLFGFILNLPFVLFSFLAVDKAFQRSESILFSLMYILIGCYFGFLLHKYQITHG